MGGPGAQLWISGEAMSAVYHAVDRAFLEWWTRHPAFHFVN
jgi:hypothetical protein